MTRDSAAARASHYEARGYSVELIRTVGIVGDPYMLRRTRGPCPIFEVMP